MPIFDIRDDLTGKIISIEGNDPPTKEQWKRIAAAARIPSAKEEALQQPQDLSVPGVLSTLFDPSEMAIMAATGGVYGPAKGAIKRAVNWGTFGIPKLLVNLPRAIKAGINAPTKVARGIAAKELEKIIPPERAIPITIEPTTTIAQPTLTELARQATTIPTPPAKPEEPPTQKLLRDARKAILPETTPPSFLRSAEDLLKSKPALKPPTKGVEAPPPIDTRPIEPPPKPKPSSKAKGKGMQELESPTTIDNLSKSITQITPPNAPVGEQMRIGERLGGALSLGKDSLVNSWTRMKGISASLWNAYKSPPIVTDYKKALGTYLSDRMYHNLAVDRFARESTKHLSPLTQEGIVNYIEAAGDTTTLLQRIAMTTDPHLKRGYEAALTLTPKQIKFAQETRNYFDTKLNEAISAGLIDHGVENYAFHIFERNPKLVKQFAADINLEANLGLINRNFAGFKKRFYDTYFDAEQKGFRPRNKQIGFLISAYEKGFGEALHSTQLINTLKNLVAEDGQPLIRPRGAVKVMKDLYPLKGGEKFKLTPKMIREYKEMLMGYKEIPHPAMNGLLVHPSLVEPWTPGQAKLGYPNLRNILTTSAIKRSPIGSAIQRGSATAKGTILSLLPSPFHQFQTAEHAIFHMVNPTNLGKVGNFLHLQNLPKYDDLITNNPLTKELVSRGLMVYNSRALEEFGEGLAGGGMVQDLIPYGKKYGEYLFGDFIPRVKAKMALDAFERNLQRYAGKYSRDQIAELTASQSNAAFGELNHEWTGRNKTMQDIIKLMFFAPDFLEARLRFVGQALSPGGKEQLYALGRGALGMFGVARVLNMILNGGDPKWGEPFGVVIDDKVYSIRSVPGDMEHAYDKPLSFLYYRLHPTTVRTAIETLTGRDATGRERTWLQQIGDFFSSHTPIPMQGVVEAAKKVFREHGFSTENIEPIFYSLLQNISMTRYTMRQEKPVRAPKRAGTKRMKE